MLLNTTKIRNPKNPQNCRTVLSPIPIDGESRAVSKKVLTLDEAQKPKRSYIDLKCLTKIRTYLPTKCFSPLFYKQQYHQHLQSRWSSTSLLLPSTSIRKTYFLIYLIFGASLCVCVCVCMYVMFCFGIHYMQSQQPSIDINTLSP